MFPSPVSPLFSTAADSPTSAAATFDHPYLRALADYWWAVKPEGRLPGRQHLDPLDLPPRLLPWLYLMDVVPTAGGGDLEKTHFRFRLIGTGLVDKFGRDSTGRWFDELYDPDDMGEPLAGLRAVIAAGQPLALDRFLPTRDKEFLSFRRVLCPLARDGRTVDMLLGIHVYKET